jgi:predicted HicB family RNase H-like nuclease
MENNNDFYTYRVTWSVEDNEYIGSCIEFPSLSWLATDQESALRGIRKVVAEVVADMQSTGEKIPEPLATKKYSGRFLVRIPPERHRELSFEAHEAGISLNRLTSDLLSRGR